MNINLAQLKDGTVILYQAKTKYAENLFEYKRALPLRTSFEEALKIKDKFIAIYPLLLLYNLSAGEPVKDTFIG